MRSLPFRLISRTFSPSRRAMNAETVVLDLVIQSGPVGGVLARRGRQGAKEVTGARDRNKRITLNIIRGAAESESCCRGDDEGPGQGPRPVGGEARVVSQCDLGGTSILYFFARSAASFR